MPPANYHVEERPGRGRCVIASRDLRPGAVVMRTVAVASVLQAERFGSRCNCCLRAVKKVRCSGRA